MTVGIYEENHKYYDINLSAAKNTANDKCTTRLSQSEEIFSD